MCLWIYYVPVITGFRGLIVSNGATTQEAIIGKQKIMRISSNNSQERSPRSERYTRVIDKHRSSQVWKPETDLSE